MEKEMIATKIKELSMRKMEIKKALIALKAEIKEKKKN